MMTIPSPQLQQIPLHRFPFRLSIGSGVSFDFFWGFWILISLWFDSSFFVLAQFLAFCELKLTDCFLDLWVQFFLFSPTVGFWFSLSPLTMFDWNEIWFFWCSMLQFPNSIFYWFSFSFLFLEQFCLMRGRAKVVSEGVPDRKSSRWTLQTFCSGFGNERMEGFAMWMLKEKLKIEDFGVMLRRWKRERSWQEVEYLVLTWAAKCQFLVNQNDVTVKLNWL